VKKSYNFKRLIRVFSFKFDVFFRYLGLGQRTFPAVCERKKSLHVAIDSTLAFYAHTIDRFCTFALYVRVFIHSHFFGQNHVPGIFAHLYSSNSYGIMFKVTFLFNRAYPLIVSPKGCQILFVTSSNR